MRRLTPKLKMKISTVSYWKTQAYNPTTNQKVKINSFSPKLRLKKTMMWECHVDAFFESSHDMILCIYLLTALVLNFNFPKTPEREVTEILKYGQHL